MIKRIVRNRQHIEKFSLCLCPCTDEHLYPCEEDEIEKINEIHEIDSLCFKVIKSLGMPSLKELEFANLITCGYRYFLLPSTILSAKHLTCPVLNGFDLCTFWSSSSLDINFTSLKKLDLNSVMIDDNILKKLMAGSVSSLETLKLNR